MITMVELINISSPHIITLLYMWCPGEGIGYPLQYSWGSLVIQTVKNPPAMWETWVQSLGWEDPLEEDMATHSSILAWEILWTEEPCPIVHMGKQSQT